MQTFLYSILDFDSEGFDMKPGCAIKEHLNKSSTANDAKEEINYYTTGLFFIVLFIFDKKDGKTCFLYYWRFNRTQW